ncbi:MAG: molybdenum cofactor guanylyltransferase [Pyrinomonadaceae bacterium]
MDIDAFILIGGRSERFGSDKAFAEIDGQMLAVRAAETVERALRPKTLRFVAASEDQFRADLIFRLGRPVVSDLTPGFGAWSGLHAALSYSSTEWTFVLACDLPFISTDLIARLAEITNEEVDAVIPRQPDGRLQPLCGFYRRRTVFAVVENTIDGAAALPRLTEISRDIEMKIFDCCEISDGNQLFANVNSTADLPGSGLI